MTISKTGGNAEKLIQTVPFFGFDWPAVSNQKYAATTGSGTSVFTAPRMPTPKHTVAFGMPKR
ncbi:MAG: hypothetical protein R3C26_07955 [Calditrichia bacterium]